MIAFAPIMCILTCAARYCQVRDQRRGLVVDSPDPTAELVDADGKHRPGTGTTDAAISDDEKEAYAVEEAAYSQLEVGEGQGRRRPEPSP